MKQIEGEAPLFEKLGLTRMAQALAAHAGSRTEVLARNVANADTPGFRALDMPEFGAVYGEANGLALRSTRPAHLSQKEYSMAMAADFGAASSPNGNSVSLDQQMMKAVAARQSHEMALAVYRSTSSIVRTSLGRSN